MNTDLYRRYLHFKEHDGYCTPPGRAACAIRSARLEILLEQAIDLGLTEIKWRYDDEPYDGGDAWTDEQVQEKFNSNEWTGPFGVEIEIGDDYAGLWGIVLGPRGTDDPYARCIVTDLAYELEDELRQAIGDALDAQRPACFP